MSHLTGVISNPYLQTFMTARSSGLVVLSRFLPMVVSSLHRHSMSSGRGVFSSLSSWAMHECRMLRPDKGSQTPQNK